MPSAIANNRRPGSILLGAAGAVGIHAGVAAALGKYAPTGIAAAAPTLVGDQGRIIPVVGRADIEQKPTEKSFVPNWRSAG